MLLLFFINTYLENEELFDRYLYIRFLVTPKTPVFGQKVKLPDAPKTTFFRQDALIYLFIFLCSEGVLKNVCEDLVPTKVDVRTHNIDCLLRLCQSIWGSLKLRNDLLWWTHVRTHTNREHPPPSTHTTKIIGVLFVIHCALASSLLTRTNSQIVTVYFLYRLPSGFGNLNWYMNQPEHHLAIKVSWTYTFQT